MAISVDPYILAILRIVYRDGVQNLLFRNSPLLRAIQKTRVEGKEYRFASIFGRGGAVGGNWTFVKAQAATTMRNVEWITTPGFLFSAMTLNDPEIQASRNPTGAYIKSMQLKSFAALEGMRKQLAVALYGSGYGEFATISTAMATTTIVGNNTITMDYAYQVMGLDVGTVFRVVVRDTNGTIGPNATVNGSINTITAIDGNTITFTSTAAETWSAGNVMCYEGSRDSANGPRLPVGLAGWLPTHANRTGANWTNFISVPFYGVNRGVMTDRLAGQFVLSPANGTYKIADVITELFMRCRRAGALVDMIVMNDQKMSELMAEMNLQRNFWQATNGPGKGTEPEAVQGFSAISYAFSTSFLDKLTDCPFCPYDKVYCLERANLELITYTMAEKITNDGIAENEAGKVTPEAGSLDVDLGNVGIRLNIDDLLTSDVGEATDDGPAQVFAFKLYGTFALYNTSNAGVAVLQ